MPIDRINAIWTVERTELLKALWNDGLSASKIAGEIGGLTRSAVLGKAFRLNLVKRKTVTSVTRSRRSMKEKRPKLRWAPKFREQRPAEEALPPPDFIGIPLMETTRFSCMYPEGEGAGIMFCGQMRREGSSFCLGHHRICYHKANPSKRQTFEKAA